MHGPDFVRPDPEKVEILGRASTASLTTILRRFGIIDAWMPIKPLFPQLRTVGPALTIRTVPHRGDIGHSIAYADNTEYPGHPDDAIDAVQPGDVVVLDGRGATFEGLFGDLLSLRIQEKGAAGLVADMCIRDMPKMRERTIPIFCLGSASPGGTCYNVDYNVPIGCAGALVIPGDIMVGDEDGVVVVPQQMVDEVCEIALEFEDREDFIRIMLNKGHSLRGLYPTGPEMEARFQDWRKQERAR